MDHLPVPRRPPEESPLILEPAPSRHVPSRTGYGGYVEIDTDAGADELSQWLRYWQILVRYRMALLAATMCGALIAFLISLYETPIYVTSTMLEFQGPQQQPFEGISYMNERDPFQLQTHVQLLTSRMLQDRVSNKLSVSGQTGDAPKTTLQWLRERLRLPELDPPPAWGDAVAWARGGLTVTPVPQTRLVRIVSESPIPQAAADYVNTLAETFIEHNVEDRWSQYQKTSSWLEKAQEELKTKLEESERQLLEYASASGIVFTSNQESIVSQKILSIQAELSRAQGDRITKEAAYSAAKSRPAESLAEMLEGGLMASYESKAADLRRQLAEATTSLTDAHPKVRSLQAQLDELIAAQTRERTNILNRMQREYDAALQRERQLFAEFDDQSKVLAEQDQKLIRYKMLQREVETYRDLYDTTLQKGKEASLASALRPVNARVIDPARTPRVPARPTVLRNVMVGLAAGLLLGVGLVLVRERADASIRTPGSISLHTNLRELGVIPSGKADSALSVAAGRKQPLSLPAAIPRTVGATAGFDAVELATWSRKGSFLAESFRATLTSILMSRQNGHDQRVILVTSPAPREGKSTVVTNLAIALAEIQQRVVLIDADLRRPRLHTIFGQANTWGLSDLLQETTPCAEYPGEALARKTHVPGVYSIPSGPGTVTASRLLYSARMAELLNRLRHEFDAVLIDTPPVLTVADARILSRLVDAVVVVLRAGQTTRESAATVAELFQADGTPVLGTVLNDWDPQLTGEGHYGSGYHHYYRDVSSL